MTIVAGHWGLTDSCPECAVSSLSFRQGRPFWGGLVGFCTNGNTEASSSADGFIEALEDGYETLLGERGAGLSEGQLQRLAIARAIYSGKPVLLLDEATSALDEQTEAKVLENLRQLHNRTVIIVTHQKAALDICNRIVEMEDGRIAEHHE